MGLSVVIVKPANLSVSKVVAINNTIADLKVVDIGDLLRQNNSLETTALI